jgi:isopentenyl diphosphate isomerase/L-lactate dehydrogenase-like FMN-dependent dehydrogenase
LNSAWACLRGGGADQITPRADRQAWDALMLQPRVLRPLAGGHTRTELLGRSIVHALAAAGAQGVAHVLRLLCDELEIAMALSGCATPGRISRDLVFTQRKR